MQFRGPRDSGREGRKTPTLAPLTEWRMPAEGQSALPHDPLPRRSGFWIGMGAGLLALLVAVVVLVNEPDVADTIDATPVAERTVAKPPRPGNNLVAYAPVSLPSGLQIDRSSVLNYDLAVWLATEPTHPRMFLFDRVGFDPGSAAIRDEDRPSLQVLSQILTAYPQARLTIIANGPGSLAQERTVSIRDALLALAADPDQLNVRAGDGSESAPRLEVRVEMGVASDLDA